MVVFCLICNRVIAQINVCLQCLIVFLFTTVVAGGRNDHRNPTSHVSAKLPGAAEGVEAFADTDRRDNNGKCPRAASPSRASIFPVLHPHLSETETNIMCITDHTCSIPTSL